MKPRLTPPVRSGANPADHWNAAREVLPAGNGTEWPLAFDLRDSAARSKAGVAPLRDGG
jgi:hypothetical protein